MKHLRYTYKAVLALSIVFVMAVLTPVVAFAQSSGIGGRPANPNPNNERTKSIFVQQLQPGQSVQDAVEVINGTDQQKTIAVYGVDAVPSSGGAFACAQASDTPTGVGSWMTFSQNSVTLDAHQKATVAFTITVPASASVGEQNGCVVLQEVKAPTVQGGIGLSFRTAIRVAILVPGEIVKKLVPQGISTSYNNNKLVISPEVKNEGNVSLDTNVQTKLISLFGLTTAQQDHTFPVLRDQLTEWSFEFDEPLWGGFYRATYNLSYDSSTDGYVGSSSDSKQTVAGPSKWVFVTPQPIALGIELAVVAAVVLGVLYLRRRAQHKKKVSTHWTSYTVKSGEHIQDIAKRHNIAWRKLAASNKLKAPYHLSEGQTIKVPSAPKRPTSAKKSAKKKH